MYWVELLKPAGQNRSVITMNASSQAGLYLTITELAGDTSLKYYAKTNNSIFLGIGTVAYLGVVYILQYYLKFEKLAIMNGYWDAFSTILTTFAAVAMGEHISNAQITGLFLISGGLLLL